jgi:hypothetical protein
VSETAEQIARRALRSIAANTCCDNCQEAALVARAALREMDAAGTLAQLACDAAALNAARYPAAQPKQGGE